MLLILRANTILPCAGTNLAKETKSYVKESSQKNSAEVKQEQTGAELFRLSHLCVSWPFLLLWAPGELSDGSKHSKSGRKKVEFILL